MEWKRTFRDSKKLDPSSVPIPTKPSSSSPADNDGSAKLDLNEAELDMSYLLKRGGSFFESGDIESAIEVYSHGAKMYPKYGTDRDRDEVTGAYCTGFRAKT